MMKKMLMMTAIAAMAFGAQAGETYTYGMTWTGIKLADIEKLSGVSCYLVDKNVVAASGGAEGSKFTSSTATTAAYDGKAVMVKFALASDTAQYFVEYAGKVSFNYIKTSYGINGSVTELTTTPQQTQATQVLGTGDARKADAVKFAAENIQWDDLGGAGVDKSTQAYRDNIDKYAKDNLAAIIVANTKDDRTIEFVVPVTRNDSLFALGSNASYTEVVPEPTSGMLVFLGLAGMLLRRKRAA